MRIEALDEAIRCLEKANTADPDLYSAADARGALAAYAHAEKLVAFGKARFASRVDDAEELARVTGTSVGKAKHVVETAKALRECDSVAGALAGGAISMDQASEIVRAEKAAPGASEELLKVAASGSFQVLREESRKVVLEAEQHRGLAERQREARTARHFTDELGMRNIHLKLPPVLGEAICNRAEAEGQRLHRQAKQEGREEPFERHLADAFAKMLAGSEVTGHCERADVTILVSYEVVTRGWTDVRAGEVCKVPGLGPVAPSEAKAIAENAFLSGCSSTARTCVSSSRSVRRRVLTCDGLSNSAIHPTSTGSSAAGVARARNQKDHLEPRAAEGPTSTDNLDWKCYGCHQIKTEGDRKAGKLTPEKPPRVARTRRKQVLVKRGPPAAEP